MKNKKLKILNIIGNYYPIVGGAEKECQKLSSKFKELGHDVTVLTASKDDLVPHEIIDGISVYRKIRGWHLYEITYILSVFLLLFRFRKQFDHVICFGLQRFTAPAIVFCKLFGKKVFFRIESPGSFNQTLNLKYGHLIYKISKFAHGTIVFTKEILEILDRMDFPKDRITWIPNSVDTDLFLPGSKKQKSPITFCFVGRLVKIKGLNTFIKALGTLSKRTKNFKAFIVGEGELKTALSEQAEQYGIGDVVTFSGCTDNVLSYYKKSDIFVLPSISEGMSLAILEAMSCGLCCVGSSVGGTQELMGSMNNEPENKYYRICENGILFPPENSDALEQALRRAMEDNALRKKLSENARRSVLQNNSIDNVASCYINLFNNKQQ